MNLFKTCKDIGAILNPYKEISIDGVDWENVIYVSSRYFVTSNITGALRKKGLLDKLQPELKDYFLYIESLNKERNKALVSQTIEVTGLLNKEGIEPLLLKGVAYLLSGVYTDIGMRIIGDIDILVSEHEAHRALNILIKRGYKYFPEDKISCKEYKEHHHLKPVFHEDRVARVEIHTQLINKTYGELLPLKEIWKKASRLQEHGVSFFVPNIEHSIILNIIHEELGHKGYDFLFISFRSLSDFIMLLEKGSIDWNKIEHIFTQHGYKNLFKSYIYMAHKLLNIPYPYNIKMPAFPKMHWKLITLTLIYPKMRSFILIFSLIGRAIIDKRVRSMVFLFIIKFFIKLKEKKVVSSIKRVLHQRRGI